MSFISNLQVRVITSLIHINEAIIFYPRLRKFYKNQIKKSEPLIFDVGSNKGQTIDFFLSIYKDCVIHSFEPNLELFNMLQEKYRNNKNIILNNCGISDTTGRLLFKETVTNETSTFEELNFDSKYLKMKSRVLGVTPENIIKKTYEVEVITLAGYIKKNNIKNIDVLKIDTEGHEHKCLLGLFTKKDLNIGYIQLEQHNDDMYANKVPDGTIDSLLNKNGFYLFSAIKHGFGDFAEVLYKSGKS